MKAFVGAIPETDNSIWKIQKISHGGEHLEVGLSFSLK